MTVVDIAIIVICLLSAVLGFWRGLIKEALSLVTWIAALVVAYQFADLLVPWLSRWIDAPELRLWAARALIFVGVIFAGGLVAWGVHELMRHSGLSGPDRLLGGLFGLARGVLIIGLATIVLQLMALDQDPWWRQSRLAPYSERVASGIRHYASLGRDYLLDSHDQAESTATQAGR